MSNEKTQGSMFTFVAVAGAIVGGLVGAVAGILLAPASGKDTREQLKKKGRKLYDESKDEWDKFQKESLEPQLKKFKKEFQEKYEETRDSVKERLDTTKITKQKKK